MHIQSPVLALDAMPCLFSRLWSHFFPFCHQPNVPQVNFRNSSVDVVEQGTSTGEAMNCSKGDDGQSAAFMRQSYTKGDLPLTE